MEKNVNVVIKYLNLQSNQLVRVSRISLCIRFYLVLSYPYMMLVLTTLYSVLYSVCLSVLCVLHECPISFHKIPEDGRDWRIRQFPPYDLDIRSALHQHNVLSPNVPDQNVPTIHITVAESGNANEQIRTMCCNC
jgi:hypothetical protein